MNKLVLDPITKKFIDTGESILYLGKSGYWLGKHLSDEAKQKNRIAHLGRHHSDETKMKMSLAHIGENNSMFGKKHSPESKKKISLAHIGKPNPMLGRRHSEESKIKMSITRRKNMSDEIREKIRLSRIGKHHTKETIEKYKFVRAGINNPMYGKHLSMETRNKLSKAIKLCFQDPNYVEKYKLGIKAKPNKIELLLQSILDKYYPNTYKYVGDFQIEIGGRFPDFINVNSEKEVIELFGSFYHRTNEADELINHYKQYGFSCIVIWDEELEDESLVVNHINSGEVYTPKHSGSTIFDYGNNICKYTITYNPLTKRFTGGNSDGVV